MICPVCGTPYPAEIRYCPLDGSLLKPTVSAQDELIGRVVDDRYYVLSKLGEGGMGNVYLGEHVRTRRRCAIKVISRTYARDPEALKRFLREATNAGRINHPNVATLYDFGDTGEGVAYIAMEFVDGEPLSKLLTREGALPPVRAVEIARQVAEGVAAAHELGIVHRDLKPGNILLTQDRKGGDVVKVVDFGIARAPAEEEQSLTRTGIVIGTPEYMSPEQLIGDPVDGRSDIYSLGCILYQMLTGEQAFGGAAAQVITRRLTEEPPRPRDRRPEIPKPLDDLIVTALGRLPAERFATMEAMRDALIDAPTHPVTTGPRRLPAWVGRTRPTEVATAPSLAETVPSPVEDALSGFREVTVPAELEQAAVPEALPLDVTESVEPELDAAPAADAEPDAGVPAAPEEIEAPARRRRLVPALAATTTVGVVVVAALLVFGGRSSREAQALPEVQAEPASPPAPLVPDDHALVLLWRELTLARTEDEAEAYAAAIGRLQAAEASVAGLLAQFPGHVVVNMIADSTRAQIEATRARCESLRQVALSRNEPAPACEPDSTSDR